MNLSKTVCRNEKCTNTAAWLVGDGFAAYLLCEQHRRTYMARHRAVVHPAALLGTVR